MNKEINTYIATAELTIVQAMQKIDAGAKGILFIVSNENKLIGCVTDGDIRRWLIKTADLNALVSNCMHSSPKYLLENDRLDFAKYMTDHSISAIPVVDNNMHILNIIFRNDICMSDSNKSNELKDVPVIIMAGGKGTRLYPYTKILPKPLIPIGDIPILERIIDKFVDYGITDFYITVNYKKGMIKSYFDEIKPNYSITYINEEKPLGTAGSISLIGKKFTSPVVVANCDSLINTDLSDIYHQHINSGNKITVVSSLKNTTIPYGVLHVKENGIISSIEEKPSMSYLINTGMYIVEPDMLDRIPEDTFFHMTDLIEDALNHNLQVGIFPISEEAFLDMGEFAEMKRMEEKLKVDS